ncbi:unnamed protein product [Brassica rapa subsp. trilocularis]
MTEERRVATNDEGRSFTVENEHSQLSLDVGVNRKEETQQSCCIVEEENMRRCARADILTWNGETLCVGDFNIGEGPSGSNPSAIFADANSSRTKSGMMTHLLSFSVKSK